MYIHVYIYIYIYIYNIHPASGPTATSSRAFRGTCTSLILGKGGSHSFCGCATMRMVLGEMRSRSSSRKGFNLRATCTFGSATSVVVT